MNKLRLAVNAPQKSSSKKKKAASVVILRSVTAGESSMFVWRDEETKISSGSGHDFTELGKGLPAFSRSCCFDSDLNCGSTAFFWLFDHYATQFSRYWSRCFKVDFLSPKIHFAVNEHVPHDGADAKQEVSWPLRQRRIRSFYVRRRVALCSFSMTKSTVNRRRAQIYI